MATATAPAQSHTNREHLTPAQRFGEVVSVAIMALILAYFWQLWHLEAGFFTNAFGPWEQAYFFGPMLCSLAAPIVRVLVGRRNPARLFEIATDVFMVIGAIGLLRVFPFDFAHLGDALPGNLPALVNWLPNWFGKVVLVLQMLAGTIAAITATWQFVSTTLRNAVNWPAAR